MHKRCVHLTKGIVVEGGSRGQILTICAEPSCTVHHAQAHQSREADEKARMERQKQNEKRKSELTTRYRVLATVLTKISAPLSKPDLILIATASLQRLPHEYALSLTIRHKLIASDKNTAATNYTRVLGDHLKQLDETALCRFLIEISLLESATNTYSSTALEPLEGAAKRYRINTEKIAQTVASEFVSKQKKREQRASASVSGAPKSRAKASAKRKP